MVTVSGQTVLVYPLRKLSLAIPPLVDTMNTGISYGYCWEEMARHA